MSDRTSTTLILAGTIAPSQVEALATVLHTAGCDEDIVGRIREEHAGDHDIGPVVFEFHEMKYGGMPDGLDEALRELGLRWAWAWNATYDCGPGITFAKWAFPEMAAHEFGYDYEDHVVMVPVSGLDDKVQLAASRRAQDFITRAPFMVREVGAPASGLKTMICAHCGSDDVRQDAWAEWSTENQAWELGTVFGHAFCCACDGETRIEERALVPDDVPPAPAKTTVSIEANADLIARSVGAHPESAVGLVGKLGAGGAS